MATITKSKRRGKILVDYLRNGRGATAVAPYSTRARPGAPVSMPLAWDELGPEIGPAYFTVANSPSLAWRIWAATPGRTSGKAAAPLPAAEAGRRSGAKTSARQPPLSRLAVSAAMLRRSASMMLMTLLGGSAACFGLARALALLLGRDDLQQLLLHRIRDHLRDPRASVRSSISFVTSAISFGSTFPSSMSPK